MPDSNYKHLYDVHVARADPIGAVSDIKIAAEQEVDEITIYPTLVASYVPAYKMLKEEK